MPGLIQDFARPVPGLAPPEARRATDAALSTSARRFLLGLCIAVAVAEPLCLYLGVRGFAPVIGLAGLLCLPLARSTRDDLRGVLILAALVAWAAVASLWSPSPNARPPLSAAGLGRFTLLHVGALLVAGAALVAALRRLDATTAGRALAWIAAGFLVVMPLVVAEGLTEVKIYPALLGLAHLPVKRPDRLIANMAQGGYVVAVMAWPLGAALWRRGRVGIGLALVLVAFVPASMLLLRGVAPSAGLALSLVVFVAVLRGGPRVAAALGSATAVYVLATPGVMLAVDHFQLYARFGRELPPSWGERLHIWSFVAERAARVFPWGAGFDASRTVPGMPLHPHDAPLQVWLELGLPGAALAAAFWLWVWRRAGAQAKRDPVLGAVCAATATVYLTVSAVSFGQWQEWWLALGVFAFALCVLLGRARGAAAA